MTLTGFKLKRLENSLTRLTLVTAGLSKSFDLNANQMEKLTAQLRMFDKQFRAKISVQFSDDE